MSAAGSIWPLFCRYNPSNRHRSDGGVSSEKQVAHSKPQMRSFLYSRRWQTRTNAGHCAGRLAGPGRPHPELSVDAKFDGAADYSFGNRLYGRRDDVHYDRRQPHVVCARRNRGRLGFPIHGITEPERLCRCIAGSLLFGGLVTGLQGLVIGSLRANPIIISIAANILIYGAASLLTGNETTTPLQIAPAACLVARSVESPSSF